MATAKEIRQHLKLALTEVGAITPGMINQSRPGFLNIQTIPLNMLEIHGVK